MKLLGNVTIDYFPDGNLYGNLMVVDMVLNKSTWTSFDPMAFTPVTLGPLTLKASTAHPGWLHASMYVNTSDFPWLDAQFTFRMSVRVEDNGYTGRNFSLSIDNVVVRRPASPSISRTDSSITQQFIKFRLASRHKNGLD